MRQNRGWIEGYAQKVQFIGRMKGYITKFDKAEHERVRKLTVLSAVLDKDVKYEMLSYVRFFMKECEISWEVLISNETVLADTFKTRQI